MNEYESKPLFYNYIIVDPRKPCKIICEEIGVSFLYEPIYVGKGKRILMKNGQIYDRKNHHFFPSRWYNNLLYRKLNKLLTCYKKDELKTYVIDFNVGCSENESLLLEQKLIQQLGRVDNDTGILCNHTDGGDGGNGMIPPIKGMTFEEFYGEERAIEMKQKMSEYSSGQNNPASSTNMPKHLRKDKGRRSYKTRLKNGQVKTGQEHNFSKGVLGEEGMRQKTEKSMNTKRETGILSEMVDKMQSSKMDKSPKYKMISPEGIEYTIHFNLKSFCDEHELAFHSIYDRIKKGQFGVITTNKTKLTSKLKNTLGWIIEPS